MYLKSEDCDDILEKVDAHVRSAREEMHAKKAAKAKAIQEQTAKCAPSPLCRVAPPDPSRARVWWARENGGIVLLPSLLLMGTAGEARPTEGRRKAWLAS